MRVRVILTSIAAFAAALVLGRTIFSPGPVQSPQALVSENARAVPSAAKQVSTSQAPVEDHISLLQRAQDGIGIDREFKDTGDSLTNTNTLMTTRISKDYRSGIEHRVPAQFNAFVKWSPSAQEIRMGRKVSDATHQARRSEAKLEQRGSLTQVSFPSTYDGVDERLYVRPEGGIEHDIVLSERPVNLPHSDALAYSGFLTLSDGLTMWDGDIQITGDYSTTHDIVFKNVFGNGVMRLRAPVAFDKSVTGADGQLDTRRQAIPARQQAATACQYQITFEKEGIKLAIATPAEWLLKGEREYPVTIDPNFGPFGLQDGTPPIYVGAVGTDTYIPVHNGGAGNVTRVAMDANNCPLAPTILQYGTIPMPFAFTWYGTLHPAASPLYVHESGFASWILPLPYFPFRPPSNPCNDVPNTALPTGSYPNDGFFPYWDELEFSADPQSAIYYFVDGTAARGNRRLIIEWFKMSYVLTTQPTDVISFNLILSECGSTVEFIIKQVGEVDLGQASIGIENQTGTLGVQYCFNAKAAGQQEIQAYTAVSFSTSPLGTATITPTNNNGCIPLTACFNTIITNPPNQACQTGGPSVPPSYQFTWNFGDNTEAFTQNVCHLFPTPGTYNAMLTIKDSLGHTAVYQNGLAVHVCDIPPIVLSVTPQGGTAPLMVHIAAKSISPVIDINGQQTTTITYNAPSDFRIIIDQQGDQNFPGTYTPFANIPGATADVLFQNPSTYRVIATVGGQSFTLPTIGVGTAFVDVIDPNGVTANSMILTQSSLTIDWAGKIANANGVVPNVADDTISGTGFLNLTGLTQSDIAGQEFIIALNGYNPIFDGTLDAGLSAIQGDFATGTTGTANIQYPSGKFTFKVRGDFANSLAASNLNTRQMITEHYRAQIGVVFNSPGTEVGYDYASTAGKSAKGTFIFGKIASYGQIPGAPGGFGTPGGKEVLLSGGFLVTKAAFQLQGDVVNAKIDGLLARSGGDDLRPAATSDVIVKVGNFSETLNFSTSPTFKTTGKVPGLKFSYKAGGPTHIKALSWANKAGNFHLDIENMPNSLVGIDPASGQQRINLMFTVTPENGQQYIGTTGFDLFKDKNGNFVH